MDPFIDLISLLRPRATLWRRIEANGCWGVSFPSRNDILFCWIAAGECDLLMASSAPLRLRTNDFALIRTSAPFVLSSDLQTAPVKSEKLFAKPGTIAVKVGGGNKLPVTLFGGRFLFESVNEELLTSMLPPVHHVSSSDGSARNIHLLLQMNAAESLKPTTGSEYIVTRLMELILIEILRTESSTSEARLPGMLLGLADSSIAPALKAVHANIAHSWTLAELAKTARVSRTAFAKRFREVVGLGPIEYVQHWRMAIAKDELLKGLKSVTEIAALTGFQSTSAFSTAFKKRVGNSPAAYSKLSIANFPQLPRHAKLCKSGTRANPTDQTHGDKQLSG